MVRSFVFVCVAFALIVCLPFRVEAGLGAGVSGTFALDVRGAQQVLPQGVSFPFTLDAQGTYHLQLPNAKMGPFAVDARGVPGNLGFRESNLFPIGEPGTSPPAPRGEPVISVSPDSLVIRDVVTGSTRTDTLMVRNTGTDTLRVTNSVSSDPVFTSSPTLFTVVPGSSQKVVVTFAPTVVGEKRATLTLSYNGSGSPFSVKLIGIGLAPVPVDITPPTVISALPANGAKDIKPETINTVGTVIVFTEAINITKIQISVQAGDQKLSWQPTWSDGDTKLTLKPAQGSELGFQIEYKVTLSQVTDRAGNAAKDIIITFTTGSAPPPGSKTVSFSVPASVSPVKNYF